MKTLSLLIVFCIPFFLNSPVENNALPGKESLVDMIEKSDFIPVYFVTKEVVYSHVVYRMVTDETGKKVKKSFSTCEKIEEGFPLPESYNSCYDKVVAELNRVFKTDKFVLKEASTIPLSEKQGESALSLMAGWPAVKIQPPLKGYDFSGITNPFFVFCSVGGIYQSDDILKKKVVTYESKIKEKIAEKAEKEFQESCKEAGVKVLDEITVSLDGFMNVRFLYYDTKKKKAKYANPTIIGIETEGESFIQKECYSSINDFVDQVDPSSGSGLLETEIEGMFDDLAARIWKKHK